MAGDFSGLTDALKFAGMGAVGGGLGNLFSGWEDPSKVSDPFFDQIMNQYMKYATPGLEDPGALLNKFGSSYKPSPGFQFGLDQALQGSNHAAAAGGMAGSPSHELQNQKIASGLASQDYGNFINNALNLYGTSGGMMDNAMSTLLQKALLKYQGKSTEQDKQSSGLGSFLGGALPLAAQFAGFI